jgi:hypothetical protein
VKNICGYAMFIVLYYKFEKGMIVMIRVDNYEPIAFIRWIEDNSRDNIDELIDAYLLNNSHMWNFKLFLKFYQDYLVSKLTDKSEVGYLLDLEEFCSSSRNLLYIKIESLDKKPILHPFLQNFIYYLSYKNEYSILNLKFLEVAKDTWNSERGIVEWFEISTSILSDSILKSYDVYTNNSMYFMHRYNFNIWAIKKKCSEQISLASLYTLSRKNYLKKIAYGDYNQKIKCVYDMVNSAKMQYIDYEGYIIDFIKFLDENKIKIRKNMPMYLLDKYVDEYSFYNNAINKNKLKKYINKIIKDKKSLIKLLEMFTKKETIQFDIEKYYECKNHCILLFEANGNLSGFFEKYLEDLHNYSSSTLNIYFTAEDLKNNISAYKKIEKFCFIKVEKKEIPCLLVWNHEEVAKTISLYKLEHKDIYLIIKQFIDCLEQYSFNESISLIEEKIKEYKDNMNEINKYYFNNSRITSVGDGTIVMNSKSENIER